MKPVLFRGASVWDGSGAPAFPADVLVEGARIKSIARASERLDIDGALVIDARRVCCSFAEGSLASSNSRV